jgi:hypothetical protein
MMVGARAALAIKIGASSLASLAVVTLAVVFWPTVKPQRIGARPAVEQPVFVVASALKPPAPPTSVAATPVAEPVADKQSLNTLATALKSQGLRAGVAPAPVASATPAAPVSPANREAESCFAHGLIALAKGDIAAARRWLEHAADEGETRAFLALGDAYNPAVLPRLGVLGARGDAAQARDYYNRAVAAGLSGAKDRLASLDPGAD